MKRGEKISRAIVRAVARGVIRGIRKKIQNAETETVVDLFNTGIKINLNKLAGKTLDYADRLGGRKGGGKNT